MILETPLQELQQYETLLARMQRQMEAELERRTSENRIDSYYPDEGPLRRKLYPKHLEFFRAGIEHRESFWMAFRDQRNLSQILAASSSELNLDPTLATAFSRDFLPTQMSS